MEDFKLDLIIGQGPGARTVRIRRGALQPGRGHTRLGLLTSPLRDRFGVIFRLEFLFPAGTGPHRDPRRPESWRD